MSGDAIFPENAAAVVRGSHRQGERDARRDARGAADERTQLHVSRLQSRILRERFLKL
jgi:hypothetical protein